MTNSTEVKLLTLLNVSAVKRPKDFDKPGGFRSPTVSRAQSIDSPAEASDEGSKKRRRSVVFGGELGPSGSTFGKGKKAVKVAAASSEPQAESSNGAAAVIIDEEDDEKEDETDSFNSHFGAESSVLSAEKVSLAEGEWESKRTSLSGVGRVVEMTLPGTQISSGKARLVPSIAAAVTTPKVSSLVSQLGSYTDLYAHSLDGEADGSEKAAFHPGTHDALRSAAAAHAVNHVLKTRRKIVRNNEKLAHAAAAGQDMDSPRDQAFTRPKILFLLPTRSSALLWLKEKVFPLAPAGTQIENLRPFISSFGLPADAEDPLDGTPDFPADHIENFRGNSDDNFRLGIKITRKAWRVVMPPASESKLMECDMLIASPLGLKMAAERENSTDLLSSIEILIVDGADVMNMQNWDHVQFVFKNLNAIPASPHGCDFSRVKPWYLDGNAKLLRQTLLLSRYDMPEARALLHRMCHNVAGKRRSDAAPTLQGVLERVRPGVRQMFERIDVDAKGASGESAADESDARLDWFVKKTIPALQRAATSRSQVLVVIPSYFDFVRVTNHLRKSNASYAALSEYSSNAEIGRARTLFFKGKKDMLVVTERFHFYRRYRLRGAKTVVFYTLPEHAQFYAEFLSTPFIGKDGEADVDPADVRARVLFSRFDVLRLERVVGHADARRMLTGEARFEFA